MPPALRSRLALFALLGTFLIPLGTSSLRGLTHILTCRDQTAIPFTLVVPEHGDPIIVSSRTISRGQAVGVCGGLILDMGAGPGSKPGQVKIRLPITNRTKYDWRGTVRLRLGGTVVPVAIGEIRTGQTAVDTVAVRVHPGQIEVDGSLLIGP